MTPIPIPPPPVAPPALLAGTRVPAGLTYSTILADLDFETFSAAGFVWSHEAGKWTCLPRASQGKKGLPVVGAAVYAKHPSAEVLTLAYDLKDGTGRHRWHQGDPPPVRLFAHIASGALLEAWNVAFERWMWEEVCVLKMGWPPVLFEQWRCAMAKSRSFCLPGRLVDAGAVLNLAIQKDKEGGRLIDRFTMPRNPTQADPRIRASMLWSREHLELEHAMMVAAGAKPGPARKLLEADLADSAKFADYNETDIVAEAGASAVTPDLDPIELGYWQDDQRINHRGVAIDLPTLRACASVVEQALERYNSELHLLTGVDAASKVAQLQTWLHAQGVHLDSLDEENVGAALAGPVQGPARRALELRAAVGSASVKKVFSMLNMATEHARLHDLYVWHGARTGRPTGSGPQPTNLPKAGPPVLRCGACKHFHRPDASLCPWCGFPCPPGRKPLEWSPEAAEDAITVLQSGCLAYIEHVLGDAMACVAGALRGMFVAKAGHDLVSSDFTAIEGVVIAALAGEKWRMEVFAGHGKIYEMSAARSMGLDFDEMMAFKERTGQHHPARKIGKFQELACLAGDTLVLTQRGYVPIVDVHSTDKLWDGLEWVSHEGLVHRGQRETMLLDGVTLTPDHLVSCSGSWMEANKLASNEQLLASALESGSENLPFLQRTSKHAEVSVRPLSSAHALPSSRTSFLSRISAEARALAATLVPFARAPAHAKCTGGTTRYSQTTRTEHDCWTASRPQSTDATTRTTPGIATTESAASKCGQSGVSSGAFSWPTSSLWTGGTTQALRWIASRLTRVTSRAISALSPRLSTCGTDEPSKACSNASTNLRSVYDIAHVGPRNRFTIRTNSGHLIVHNCGFGGWIAGWKAFGGPGTDDEIKETILKWRAASPAIEHFWGGQTKGDFRNRRPHFYGVEGAAIRSLQNPDTWVDIVRLDGEPCGVSYITTGDVLYCRLLSGRFIPYHRPRLARARDEWRGLSMSFEGYNSNPKNGPIGWIRMNTWGSRLVENIVQATARDIQMNAIHQLEQRGYPVVLHTYDEVVAEVPEGFGSVEELEAIMTAVPPWAAGWPIKAAGGWRAKRYRKG